MVNDLPAVVADSFRFVQQSLIEDVKIRGKGPTKVPDVGLDSLEIGPTEIQERYPFTEMTDDMPDEQGMASLVPQLRIPTAQEEVSRLGSKDYIENSMNSILGIHRFEDPPMTAIFGSCIQQCQVLQGVTKNKPLPSEAKGRISMNQLDVVRFLDRDSITDCFSDSMLVCFVDILPKRIRRGSHEVDYVGISGGLLKPPPPEWKPVDEIVAHAHLNKLVQRYMVEEGMQPLSFYGQAFPKGQVVVVLVKSAKGSRKVGFVNPAGGMEREGNSCDNPLMIAHCKNREVPLCYSLEPPAVAENVSLRGFVNKSIPCGIGVSF